MRAVIFHTKAEVYSMVLQMNDLGSWEGHPVLATTNGLPFVVALELGNQRQVGAAKTSMLRGSFWCGPEVRVFLCLSLSQNLGLGLSRTQNPGK